jgi:hypothetical protein
MLQRMAPCAQRLGLRLSWADGDQIRQQVSAAHFCQQRFCPVCDWRRTVAWRRRLLPGLEQFHSDRPKWQPLFLTLTVKNVPLGRTAQAIRELHESWTRLTKRAEFPSDCWLRRTELTVGSAPQANDLGLPGMGADRYLLGWIDLHGVHTSALGQCFHARRPSNSEAHGGAEVQDLQTADSATAPSQSCDVPDRLPLLAPGPGGVHWMHPHIHALVMVPPSYWSTGYVKQSRWRELWMDCARLDYAPIVDVRKAYVRKSDAYTAPLHLDAVIEASKYISKHSDLLCLGPEIASLQQEIRGQRMIGVSRGLAPYVRKTEPTAAELTDLPELADTRAPMADLLVQWDATARTYTQIPSQ